MCGGDRHTEVGDRAGVYGMCGLLSEAVSVCSKQTPPLFSFSRTDEPEGPLQWQYLQWMPAQNSGFFPIKSERNETVRSIVLCSPVCCVLMGVCTYIVRQFIPRAFHTPVVL